MPVGKEAIRCCLVRERCLTATLAVTGGEIDVFKFAEDEPLR